MSPKARTGAGGGTTRDAVVALKNAFKLGASLIATWGVAILVRLYLPRHLGPEPFGVFNFADAFAASAMVVLSLGVDLYIQKTIPVRPAHASDFFGGIIAVRLAMSVGVFAVMAAIMAATHRSALAQRVAFLFGAGQVLSMVNGSLAAMLLGAHTVDGLALVNVVAKLLWGAGMAVAIWARLGLPGLAFAFVASELARMIALFGLTRRHVGLRLRIDTAAVKLVIWASLPFYVGQIANTIYAKVGVSMLSVLSNDAEVGYYGTASNLASLALLLLPLVSWVLLPLMSRAAARSSEEMFAILRRSIEAIMICVLPIALLLIIGADVWIPRLFGPAFTPAIRALRVLSPIFVFTCLATLAAIALAILDRAWTLALISIAALALDPALNLVLVPWGARTLGVGGAGAGAALALLLTEMSVTAALVVSVGREAFDRRSAASIGKTLACCVFVAGVDLAIRPLGLLRLALDLALCAGLLFAVGAVRLGEIVQLARFLRRQPREPGA